jgi:cephalosporin hydroxylase
MGQPITKTVARYLRWLLHQTDCRLSPAVLDGIQAGTLAYTYRGRKCSKNPFDLAIYTLLIGRLKPRTIFEIGTGYGGSALWFADQLSAQQIDGHVYSVDVQAYGESFTDPRISFLRGDALALQDVFPASLVKGVPAPLLVVDDGAHTPGTVRAVLDHFSPLMRRGDYFAIEDGNLADLGLSHKFGGGPAVAIRQYLAENLDLVVDDELCNYFGRDMTFNLSGYLRKL